MSATVIYINMTFGKWLAARRNEARLTQAQLAKRAGISPSYVSGLEREEVISIDGLPRQPKRDKVEALAKALNVDVNEALEAAGYKTDRPTFQRPTNMEELASILATLGVEIQANGGLYAHRTEEQFEALIDDIAALLNFHLTRRPLRDMEFSDGGEGEATGNPGRRLG